MNFTILWKYIEGGREGRREGMFTGEEGGMEGEGREGGGGGGKGWKEGRNVHKNDPYSEIVDTVGILGLHCAVWRRVGCMNLPCSLLVILENWSCSKKKYLILKCLDKQAHFIGL